VISSLSAQIPAAVFTHPETAMVGLTEDYCKANNVPIIVKKSFSRANGKALAMNETDGMVKLIASATDGKLLGCHLFGAHAANLVQEVSALICKGTTTKEFCDVIHGHPTLGEVIQAAAQQFEE
jgi:dihydrolipoamide dehydrogenase